MTWAPEERSSAALDSLVELGRDGAQEPTRTELDAGLNAVRERLEASRVRRVVLSRVAVFAVLLTLPFAWIYGGRWLAPELPMLTYEIAGGSILEGGYLRESGDTGITLSFSEGTQVALAPGCRGRLRTVDAEGARVGIENGSASFEVTPTSGRRWEVEVGPFLVRVTGTAFTVSWDPSSEQFELRLRRGRVVVSGPVSGGELTLQAGQRLVVSLSKAETLITEDRTPEGTAQGSGEPTSDATPSATSEDEPTTDGAGNGATASATEASKRDDSDGATPPSSPSPKGSGRRWAEELANGRWDRILEDAERAGIASTLANASSEELFALANAARYRRRNELARKTLLAQRSRFPGSSRALDAAFLLGRVEEARGSGMTRAIAWYDEYLARAPTGTYAAEALGRKMTIVSQSSGPTQARPIAKDYLRRFPNGSYAGSARLLLDDR